MDFFKWADSLDQLSISDLLDRLQTELEEDDEVLYLQIKQWDIGEDAKGLVLGYYSYMSEILSYGRKLQGDRYNLLNTGAFRAGTYLTGFERDNDISFLFDSSDPKTSILLDEISDDIFGLQEKNLQRFTTIAVDKAIKILNQLLKI